MDQSDKIKISKYWPSASAVDQCVIPSVESVNDALLLAVHQKFPLDKMDSRSGVISESASERTDEDELLRYLLEKNISTGIRIVPITGASGAGKSHLVRVLKAKIEQQEQASSYVIIYVAKELTSYQVVEKILESNPLQTAEYDELRKKFMKVSRANISKKELIIKFRSELEVCLVEKENKLQKEASERRGSKEHANIRRRALDHLRLSELIRDPALKEHFNPILDRIISRETTGMDKEDLDNQGRNKFKSKDLEISQDFFKDSGTAMINFCEKFYQDATKREELVNFLNDEEILDVAKDKMLQIDEALGKYSIESVVIEIRKKLYEKNQELIILMEDFYATTKKESFENIFTRELQPDEKLSTIRSVIAGTDAAFYNRDTLMTRAQFAWKVRSEIDNLEHAIQYTKKLVAGYLNAARWGMEKIKEFYQPANDIDGYEVPVWGQDELETTPNIDSFGEENGIPLFPFSEKVFKTLISIKKIGDKYQFNIREILNTIVIDILKSERENFINGHYPTITLTRRLNPSVVNILHSTYSGQNEQQLQRIEKFVELYGGSPDSEDELKEIDPKIAEVFNIDWSLDFKAKPNTVGPPVPPPRPPTTPAGGTVSRRFEDLRKELVEKYKSQKDFSSELSNQLRNGLSELFINCIDWDFVSCPRTSNQQEYVGPSVFVFDKFATKPVVRNKITYADVFDSKVFAELEAILRYFRVYEKNRNYPEFIDDWRKISRCFIRLEKKVVNIIEQDSKDKLKELIKLKKERCLITCEQSKTLASSSEIKTYFFEIEDRKSKLTESENSISNQSDPLSEWFGLIEKSFNLEDKISKELANYVLVYQGAGQKEKMTDIADIFDLCNENDIGTNQERGRSRLPIEGLDVKDLKGRIVKQSNERLHDYLQKTLEELNDWDFKPDTVWLAELYELGNELLANKRWQEMEWGNSQKFRALYENIKDGTVFELKERNSFFTFEELLLWNDLIKFIEVAKGMITYTMRILSERSPVGDVDIPKRNIEHSLKKISDLSRSISEQ